MNRVIYYYQTFCGLQKILDQGNTCPVTHIHLASTHFGTKNGKPYIHLNNNSPYDQQFAAVWTQLQQASKLGIKITLMIGGAGGGFASLFENFEVYYPMLQQLLTDKHIITGIDLDVEESVGYDNISMLISRIVRDYPTFRLSLAPVASSLANNQPGMGGFVYKELYNQWGEHIDYFNGQFYVEYTVQSYKDCINHGFPASKVVMGMIECNSDMLSVVSELSKNENDFGGVFYWEYFAAPKNWEQEVANAMKPTWRCIIN